jgi:hypothetical protein
MSAAASTGENAPERTFAAYEEHQPSTTGKTGGLGVEVPRLSIRTIAAKAEEELRELTGLSALPFVSAMVKMEIKGVPTAVANALRRVLCDEMRGRCLIASKAPTTTYSFEDNPIHTIDQL